jgi:hypothetical protein|tara:strand:- start:905 stop:1180 length:276 start_codon:yes stop_codon:yes gene_type:complete
MAKAKTKTAPVVETEQKVVPAKKTPKKAAPKTPAPAETKPTKLQKTFSEVFESDVDSQIDSFVSANGADGYEVISETKGDDAVVKTIEITL